MFIAKLLSVALLFGSFVCVLVLIAAMPRSTPAEWQGLVDAIGTLFKTLIVPTSLVTVLLGLLLAWRRRPSFFRERWGQLKILLIVTTLPALHLAARGVFLSIRREVESGSPEGPTGRLQLFAVLVGATVVAVLVVSALSHAKPRLRARAR